MQSCRDSKEPFITSYEGWRQQEVIKINNHTQNETSEINFDLAPPPISSPRQIAHLNRTSEMILRLSSDLGQKPFGGIGKLDDTPACTGHTSKS